MSWRRSSLSQFLRVFLPTLSFAVWSANQHYTGIVGTLSIEGVFYLDCSINGYFIQERKAKTKNTFEENIVERVTSSCFLDSNNRSCPTDKHLHSFQK